MSFTITGVYRPPSANDAFYDQLTEMLRECNHNKELILMGDFNLDWGDSVRRKKLKGLADKYNLDQLIKGVTRIAKKSSTQLDLIFTNKPERITKSYNLITGLSDHNLTLVARNLTKNRFKFRSKTPINFLGIPKTQQAEFDNEISDLSWEDVIASEDLEGSCNIFVNNINSVRERFTVKIQKKCKRKQNLPWLTDNVWKLMKQRDAALRKAIKSKVSTDLLIFKGLRNKVIYELRQAKSQFYLNILHNAKGNSKLIWQGINNLMRNEPLVPEDIQLNTDGILTDDKSAVAKILNHYFIDSVNDLGRNFTERELDITPITPPDEAFVLAQTDVTEVNKMISSLKNSKCRDVFQFDTMFIKKHQATLVPPIAHLIYQ
ncbi:uncharacterized protein LOC117525349 [Thalassophryne amazonica]|uniref:uncharacterized protein LOC117525349 n=1 Tax=Thalassophryne amazonica TaxID=390379 RepID=UPI0014718A92|nr:uncharacterized protein LOC117525349 [Thalassophryne amazonica]